MRLDPTTTFLLILAIGAIAGLLFDRLVGRRWLSRTFAGRQGVTGALVGIAGAFIGFHLAVLLRMGSGATTLIAAAIGALVVLWVWRMLR